jgi:hypothetical protein
LENGNILCEKGPRDTIMKNYGVIAKKLFRNL